MDGETPNVRTCGDCNVKRDLENFVGENKCCERCLEKRRRYRAKYPEKVKERSKKYRGENSEQIKAYRNEYNKIEIDCEFCECKVKKCRWKTHTETQKHENNEMIKRKEEDKVSKMTDEEKEEYFMIKKLKKIWNKVRL